MTTTTTTSFSQSCADHGSSTEKRRKRRKRKNEGACTDRWTAVAPLVRNTGSGCGGRCRLVVVVCSVLEVVVGVVPWYLSLAVAIYSYRMNERGEAQLMTRKEAAEVSVLSVVVNSEYIDRRGMKQCMV